MKLPRNEFERDQILHGTAWKETGTRNGVLFAESYHRMRPKLSFANVLATADSLVLGVSAGNPEAYRLSFVITYMKLENYELPWSTTEMVTYDHSDERIDDAMLNKVMLIGNLGKDPELNVTGDGTPVARFSLAVSRKWGSGNERREETEWFNIIAWRQLAEICDRYLTKGSKVYVEGRISQRKYTDRDGLQRTAVEIIIHDMQMLQTKSDGNGNGHASKPVHNTDGSSDPFLPDYPDEA